MTVMRNKTVPDKGAKIKASSSDRSTEALFCVNTNQFYML